MYARASENVASVPSFDALVDAAVVWCARYFQARDDGDTSEAHRRLGKWWFWTGAGVVVAGVAIGVVIATSSDTQGKPLESNTGITVQTLTF